MESIESTIEKEGLGNVKEKENQEDKKDQKEVVGPTGPVEPNVIFVGTRRVQGKKVRSETAPQILIDGARKFEDLPPSEEQVKGFYYERAAELCRAFPGLYKRFKNKGD